MKHELETIARHYELAQCHEQHNRYLALAISETLTHNTVADLEPNFAWLDRIDCHQNPVEGYVTVIRALRPELTKFTVRGTATEEEYNEHHLFDQSIAKSARCRSLNRN